jgi:hypothetical protein
MATVMRAPKRSVIRPTKGPSMNEKPPWSELVNETWAAVALPAKVTFR